MCPLFMRRCRKKGQVWVETVTYTLIAFVLMGLVLAFVRPKIETMQDEATIKQTLGLMESLNERIFTVAQGGSGNRRLADLSLNKGTLTFSDDDTIRFEMNTRELFSEEGEEIEYGSIRVNSSVRNNQPQVVLLLNYSGRYSLSPEGGTLPLTASSTPYALAIENKGPEEMWGTTGAGEGEEALVSCDPEEDPKAACTARPYGVDETVVTCSINPAYPGGQTFCRYRSPELNIHIFLSS